MSAGRIPPDLLKRIKDAVNIVDVVGEHVVLRKVGSNHTGLCPFHSERSPSFGVSEAKQLYHCYGCKAGGDLVTFVQEIHGLSFVEAVQELAERGSVKIPAGVLSDVAGAGERSAAERAREQLGHRLNRFAAKFFRESLLAPEHAGVRGYFEKRGVDAGLSESFYLGAAPNSWEALARKLVQAKAPLDLAVELGLIRPSRNAESRSGVPYFDLFRGRAIFPIIDLRGKVSGFGGRILEGSDGDGPKYLNSPDSFLFRKSRLLYGLPHAARHAREEDSMILVEGYFDVIGLHAAGFRNVVATCGTALTKDHLQAIRRLASKVIVLFDGDRAGRDAIDRAMETGLELGLVLHGAFLPDGADPDDLALASRGAPQGGRLGEILRAAEPLLDLRMREAVEESRQGPEARTQALKRVAAWLSRFNDPVGRGVRAEAFRAQIGVSGDLFRRALAEGGAVAGSSAPAPAPRPAPQGRPAPRKAGAAQVPVFTAQERILFSGLVLGSQFADEIERIRADLPPGTGVADLFEYPPARELTVKLVGEGPVSGPAMVALRERPGDLLGSVADPQVRSAIAEALMGQPELPAAGDFRRLTWRAVSRLWERVLHRLAADLGTAESVKDARLQEKLNKEFLDVSRKIKELGTFYGQDEVS